MALPAQAIWNGNDRLPKTCQVAQAEPFSHTRSLSPSLSSPLCLSSGLSFDFFTLVCAWTQSPSLHNVRLELDSLLIQDQWVQRRAGLKGAVPALARVPPKPSWRLLPARSHCWPHQYSLYGMPSSASDQCQRLLMTQPSLSLTITKSFFQKPSRSVRNQLE